MKNSSIWDDIIRIVVLRVEIERQMLYPTVEREMEIWYEMA